MLSCSARLANNQHFASGAASISTPGCYIERCSPTPVTPVSVKCDEKDKNFQKKQSLHNVEASASAIFMDKVKFDSDSRLLSCTLSQLKNSKINDGFGVNVSKSL
ncbi:hypothetical protein NDU88_006030 [Pleurodeles waltl]|uniref:Uncharacterized protein n=1 Tax=Pleurodeles waltl TaxID=8319 RepID=A0AAV7VNL2_PLEWA|nr:hypothetical protein NDU88_006030 [Pleurodeles waltl]